MRTIDISSFQRVAIPDNLGPAPDLRWLSILDLVVDPDYQREIVGRGMHHVRRIAEAFDWRMFSAVVVSPVPGGKYAIIDGQHRTTAAALAGQDSVPCQIIQADRRQQARAFEAINGTKRNVTRDQRYRAALAAGDPEAERIQRLTSTVGIQMLTFNPNRAKMRPGDCSAHTAIMRLINGRDDTDATFVLRCARAAAGEMTGVLSSPALLGISDAFLDCPDWLGRPDVIKAFEALDLSELWRSAIIRARQKPGTTTVTFVAAMVVSHVTNELGGGGHAKPPSSPSRAPI